MKHTICPDEIRNFRTGNYQYRGMVLPNRPPLDSIAFDFPFQWFEAQKQSIGKVYIFGFFECTTIGGARRVTRFCNQLHKFGEVRIVDENMTLTVPMPIHNCTDERCCPDYGPPLSYAERRALGGNWPEM